MEDIIFETGLDITQLERDLERARRAVEKLRAAYEQKSSGLEANSQALEQQEAQIEALKQKIAEYKEILEHGGTSVGFEKYSEAFTNLPKAEAELAEMEKSYNKALDANIRLSESTEKTAAELTEAEQRAEGLAQALAEAQAETANTTDPVDATGEALEETTEKADVLSVAISRVGDSLNGVNKTSKRSLGIVGKFLHRVKRLALRVMIFSVITRMLRSVRSALSGMIKQNEEATKSFDAMKEALRMMALPVINALIPILITLARWATKAALALANLFARLSGKSLKDLQKSAKALSTAGKASKSMASFDTVQTLGNSGGGGGSSSGGLDISQYESKLDELMVYMSGALMAIGLILCLSGANIPLGISLIAIGAAQIAAEIALNWNAMAPTLLKAINNVLPVVAGAFLVIGSLLAFSGVKTGLGIAMIAIGAAALVAAVAVNWKSQNTNLKTALDMLTKIAAGALLANGLLLIVTGANIPLGIGLLVAGAATLASAIALNSEAMPEKVRHVLSIVLSIAAGALIALGLFFILTSVTLGLGIALLAAGAVAAYTAATINEDEAPNRVNKVLTTIARIVGGALLAIGVILCLTGAIPIGIALMAVGALTIIASTAKIDWESVQKKVSDVLGTLLAIISGASIVVGLLLCLTGVGLPIGLALILAGIAGTTKAVTVTDNPIVNFVKGMVNAILKMVNWLISQINKISFNVPDWVPLIGGKKFGFNLKSIPYLAQGAVIPPNREFLAVLGDQKSGTNIEAPLDTIVQAFRQVMLEGSQEIEVNFTGSMAQFVAMLDKEITISRRNRGR